MKQTSMILAAAIALAVSQVNAAVVLENDAQKVGYALGTDMGSSLQQIGGENREDIDFNAVIVGLRDAYQGKTLAMNEEEMNDVMKVFTEKRMQAIQEELARKATENAEKGKAFLAENAKKDGVKTTASGLQYKVEKEGSGVQPKEEDKVTVEYVGRLIDGTEFDNSQKHNQPITFQLQDVIPGWVEGLQLMKEGGKYTFYIPAELAYGENGAGPAIPPNSTLIFDVELKKVESVATEEKEVSAEAAVEKKAAEQKASEVEAQAKTDAEVKPAGEKSANQGATEQPAVATEPQDGLEVKDCRDHPDEQACQTVSDTEDPEVEKAAAEIGDVVGEAANKVGKTIEDAVESVKEAVENNPGAKYDTQISKPDTQ